VFGVRECVAANSGEGAMVAWHGIHAAKTRVEIETPKLRA
jgi:hypothetical protein